MTQKEIKALKLKQKTNLINKYRALFLELYELEGVEYGVSEYIMQQILDNGKVSMFMSNTNKEARIVMFGPYATKGFDWKNSPVQARPMNQASTEVGKKIIPQKYMEVDEEIVLLELPFIPKEYIEEYVTRILDIEATIRTNLQTLKMPFVITSLNPKQLDNINKLLNDELVLVQNAADIDVINTPTTYVVDKLNEHKNEVEAELLTILGVDNVKFEKAAQMAVDEINANNEEVSAYRNIIQASLERFIAKGNEVFGQNIRLKKREVEMQQIENNNTREEGDVDDEL